MSRLNSSCGFILNAFALYTLGFFLAPSEDHLSTFLRRTLVPLNHHAAYRTLILSGDKRKVEQSINHLNSWF